MNFKEFMNNINTIEKLDSEVTEKLKSVLSEYNAKRRSCSIKHKYSFDLISPDGKYITYNLPSSYGEIP
jgi:hypothetical protein